MIQSLPKLATYKIWVRMNVGNGTRHLNNYSSNRNKILYEAGNLQFSNADFNDDRLTEEIVDKPPPPGGSAGTGLQNSRGHVFGRCQAICNKIRILRS